MRLFCGFFFLIFVLKTYANDQMTVLAQSDEYVSYPAITIDERGNALALWRDEKLKGIYSSRYDAHKQKWDPVTRLSSNEKLSLKDFDPSIQMDNQGNAIAVWVGDQVHGIYYDVFTKQWSEPAALINCEKCQSPAITVDAKGNAIAIWSNTISNTIQSSRFDKISKTWLPTINLSEPTRSHSFLNPLKPEDKVPSSPKICVDKLGNAIAIWIQHGENNEKMLRAAYCDHKTNVWNMPFTVTFAKDKKISGIDIYINPSDNPVIIWADPDIQSIYASEYDLKVQKLVSNGKIIGLGTYPHVVTNGLDQSLLVSTFFSTETESPINLILAGVDENNAYLNPTHSKAIGGFILPRAYDVGIDKAGNITAAFNIRSKNQSSQYVYCYHINSQEQRIISLNEYPAGKRGLGMNAVSVHPLGQVAVLWEGFDDNIEKHVICAWIHHAD